MYRKMRNELMSFFSSITKMTLIVMLLTMACINTIYSFRKTVVISIDGKENKVITYKRNLKSLLESEQITLAPKDKIIPSINSKIKDGDKVYIKRAVDVCIFVDGEEKKLCTAEDTIEDMLNAEDIALNDMDKIDPLKLTPITAGMNINVTRVETKLVKEYETIDYATVVKKDNTLKYDVKKIVNEGTAGEKENTFRVILENGKEVSKNLITQITTKLPVDKLVIQGTLIPTVSLSRGESNTVLAKPADNVLQGLAYKSIIRCSASAYSSEQPGLSTRTATGTTVRRDPNGYSTIAADPRTIPLGTRVYVEGYGYAVVEDTGGAIKGNKIDLYLNTIKECYSWGVRNVNVYILN